MTNAKTPSTTKITPPEFYLVAGASIGLPMLHIGLAYIDHEQLASTIRALSLAGYFNFWMHDACGNDLPRPRLHAAEKAVVTFA